MSTDDYLKEARARATSRASIMESLAAAHKK